MCFVIHPVISNQKDENKQTVNGHMPSILSAKTPPGSWSPLWIITGIKLVCCPRRSLKHASVLGDKVRARECHASLAHFSATNRLGSMILWCLINTVCFLLYVEFSSEILLASIQGEKLLMPQWLRIIADSPPKPIPSQEPTLTFKIFVTLLYWCGIWIYSPSSISKSLYLRGAAAFFQSLRSPVVVDQYLIPFKIPPIMYLLPRKYTILQQWKNRVVLDNFSTCGWRPRCLWWLFFFFSPCSWHHHFI